MKKLLSLLVLSLSLALVATACGRADDPTVTETEDGTSADSPAADHNEADIAFVQGMIPHHEQAVEMADLVIAGGENAEVKALAEEIKANQSPEIELMRGFLEDWDVDPTTEEDSPHGGMAMMSEDDMAELEKATGAELDRMFLEMMIEHHESAITMAETELEDGQADEAKELATQIIATQQAEITRMNDLLSKVG